MLSNGLKKQLKIIRILQSIFLLSLSSYFLLPCGVPSVYAKTEDALQLSGFARVVLGYLDEGDATYFGYDDSISFNQQSLVGLQADYKILDNLSATGQFIGHRGSKRESGLEWLYLTYTPTRSTQIKLGKQRIPFFNYSDSLDVGFAYPWITLPRQVYSAIFLSTFEGVLANYQWSGGKIGFDIEGYWGSFDDVVSTLDAEVPAKVSALRGLITKINYDNWTFRASYHTGDTIIGLPELKEFSSVLGQFGFIQSAESLNSDGKAEFYQIAASYDSLDYFFRTEVTQVDTRSAVIPNTRSYFVTAGYNHYPFLSYVSFAKNKTTYGAPAAEIPVGFDPQLDALASGYQSVFDALPLLDSQSITLGTRWDFKSNLALKVEVTLIKANQDSIGNNNSSFVVLDEANFDKKAPLYQLALEWVF
jgi:hypothetical protein